MRSIIGLQGPAYRWGSLALVVALVAILILVVRIVADLPAGFGNAQAESAMTLFDRGGDQQRTLVGGADRDLQRFIPGYVIAGMVAAVAALLLRRRMSDDLPLAGWVVGLLAFGALADIVETVLFRRSLQRLIDGAVAADIDRLVLGTRLFMVVKFASLVASIILLIHLALRK